MKYRILPHGGEKISVIGFGGGRLSGGEKENAKLIESAIEAGINYFDVAPSEKEPFYAFAKAFAGMRDKIVTQMHFGAVYDDGKYGWSRDVDKIKRQIEWQLELMKTDYTDMGFIHCIDEQDDLDEVMNDGLWNYMRSLKDSGVIRHLGFSSHIPSTSQKIIDTGLIDTGLIDMIMFSINPAYDYKIGEYALGETAERAALYSECEARGIGISVMKPFAGGHLLSDKLSPFKKALTHNQLIQYALDYPAVLTVLPGISNMDELQTVLKFTNASVEECDYSVICEFVPNEGKGVCVYCNHCQPCPKGLNIGLINKYYDLARTGDKMAEGHYFKLPVRADDCVKCGHCEKRCPFHVQQERRMEEINSYFGSEEKDNDI